MTNSSEIVVVSSALENRRKVMEILARQGLEAVSASTVRQYKEILETHSVGLVFCDHDLSDGDYRDIVAASCSTRVPKIVMMAAALNSAERDEVKRRGVFDIISAPCRPTDLEWMVIITNRAEQIRLNQPTVSRIGPLSKITSAGVA